MTFKIYKTYKIHKTEYASLKSMEDVKDFFFKKKNWEIIDYDIEDDNSGADFAVKIGSGLEIFVVEAV